MIRSLSGSSGAEKEIQHVDADSQRAGTSNGSRRRSPILRPWGHYMGGQGFWNFLSHDMARSQGTAKPEEGYGFFTDSPPWRWTEETSAERTATCGGPGIPCGAGDARGSYILASLDKQEFTNAVTPASKHGTFDMLRGRRQTVAGIGIQLASQSERRVATAATASIGMCCP